jgi:ABC-type phosphate transport system substrate-binding protein
MGNRARTFLALLSLVCIQASGSSAAQGPDTSDKDNRGADHELVIVVNPRVPVTALSAAELEGLFTGARRYWSDSSPVLVFNYPPESPLRRHFDRTVLRMSPDDVARFWRDQLIRHGVRAPRHVSDAHLMIRIVAKLPGAVAYVPAHLAGPTVKVVARLKGDKLLVPSGAKPRPPRT